MQLTRLKIKNFRCIEELDFCVASTTVLIGENNTGKTSIVDAIRIALGRRWGRSGTTGFSEFDFRKVQQDGATKYEEIEIYLYFAERAAGEWSEDLVGALNDIIVTDTETGFNSIQMRVRCSFEDATKSVEPEWQFLNEAGQPFAGRGARNQNLSNFFDYVPAFSMSARRDASTEFTGRSKLWGGLLKTINIDEVTTTKLEAGFATLNDELLKADPKVEAIKTTLGEISRVIAKGAAGSVDLRAIPADLWDILSKSQLVVQGTANDPWLPIICHGQGVQSLAIIFLFRAFVENALVSEAGADAKPLLLLEEPEAHLHPQAIRALWAAISGFPGQKIVTTHSPYFVQNAPISDIVILRRDGAGPSASSVTRSFHTAVPINADLRGAVGKHASMSLEGPSERLTLRGSMTKDEYQDLLKCYTGGDRNEIHALLKELRDRTSEYLSDDELSKLESWAKRIRGEIFFARKWLLCEGQSEYAVLSAVADRLGVPVDAHGIALIDYQNNGSAGSFASLARAMRFPWAMICDGDDGGNEHIEQLRNRNFSDEAIEASVTQLPASMDLEVLIVQSGLRPLLLEAVRELSESIPDDDAAILQFAGQRKEETAVRLARRIRGFVGELDFPLQLREPFVKLGEIAP